MTPRVQQPAGARSGFLFEIFWVLRSCGRAMAGLRLRERLMAEQDRWLLFVPVAIAIGILGYFQLAREPLWALCLFSGLLGLAGIVALGRSGPVFQDRPILKAALVGLGLIAVGFGIAGLRAHHVAAPVIERQGAFTFSGRIIGMEPRNDGYRLVLEDLAFDELAAAATPARIRVTTRTREPELQIGDRIAARGMLQAPSAPLYPGSFDFGRRAFFEQLGGLGFTFGTVERVDEGKPRPFFETVAATRHAIAAAATEAIDAPESAVAAALLTGLRGNIPDKVWSDMQASGLAHLLAISGLHIGLIAGTIFLLARHGLALIEPLALRYPIKKLAALIALVGAFAYLLLAGATVPTQRAFMMAGIALLAVMVDRNPISMRLVAIAAMGVLLHRPESVLGASFQMSFSAVIALVAFYESRPKLLNLRTSDDELSLPRHLLLYFLGISATTLIATIATTGFAAVHFQRIAVFGVLANLLAVPITAFWIMPAGLLVLLLMPFGLEDLGFAIMGPGIGIVLDIAAWFAALPGASVATPPLPAIVLPLTAFGGLWLCLWRGAWRRWGLVPMGLALIMAFTARSPDVLIARGGLALALKVPDNVMILESRRRDRYRDDVWARAMTADVIENAPQHGRLADGLGRCDPLGCNIRLKDKTIAIARRGSALAEDCRRADLVIILTGASRCANGTPSIGPSTLWWAEGISIGLDPLEIRKVREERGERPWAPG